MDILGIYSLIFSVMLFILVRAEAREDKEPTDLSHLRPGTKKLTII